MVTKRFVIFCFAALIMALVFIKPYSRYKELKIKNNVLIKELEHLKKVNKTLEEEKKALEQDSDFVEKRAREKMGIVREGEIIYKIIPEDE